jgi:hypothetical protein
LTDYRLDVGIGERHLDEAAVQLGVTLHSTLEQLLL